MPSSAAPLTECAYSAFTSSSSSLIKTQQKENMSAVDGTTHFTQGNSNVGSSRRHVVANNLAVFLTMKWEILLLLFYQAFCLCEKSKTYWYR